MDGNLVEVYEAKREQINKTLMRAIILKPMERISDKGMSNVCQEKSLNVLGQLSLFELTNKLSSPNEDTWAQTQTIRNPGQTSISNPTLNHLYFLSFCKNIQPRMVENVKSNQTQDQTNKQD